MTTLSKLTSCNIDFENSLFSILLGFGVYVGLWLKTVVLYRKCRDGVPYVTAQIVDLKAITSHTCICLKFTATLTGSHNRSVH